MLTEDKYPLFFEKSRQIFQKTMGEFFINKYFCNALHFHFFVVKRAANGGESIYFDKEWLSKEEISRKPSESYYSFMQSFLRDKGDGLKCQFIIKESNSYKIDNWQCMAYWVLSFESLGDNYGALVLSCAFHRLAECFNRYLHNPELLIDRFDERQSIMKGIETLIELHMETMFSPFNTNLVNSLSGEYYEKSECQANMIFLPDSNADLLKAEDWVYQFEAIDFIPDKSRLIRKLLQIAQDSLYLVLAADNGAETYKIVGICREEALNQRLKSDEKHRIPCLRVKVKAHMLWDIFLDDTYILTSRNGHYKMNIPFDHPVMRNSLITELTGYFGEKADGYAELCDNIYQSTKQKHGTMLVILEPKTARMEADRLGGKQYGLAAADCRKQKDDINYLNAIDGSVMMDTDGRIYGIGMILDGKSVQDGDLSRGARYNSAMKYRDFLRQSISKEEPDGKKGMILIVSEDGFVDIISA